MGTYSAFVSLLSHSEQAGPQSQPSLNTVLPSLSPVNPSMLVPRLLITNYYNVNFEKPKYFWVLMNVFPAVVNTTKFQEQQKTSVLHYVVVIQHTLTGSLHGARLGTPVSI